MMKTTKHRLTFGVLAGLGLFVGVGCEADRGPAPELGDVPPPMAAEAEPYEPAEGEVGVGEADDYAYEEAGPVPIEEEAVAPGGGRSYRVQEDDTLWSIAVREYGDGQRWEDIRDANPELDPNNLPVGAELTLPD